MVMASIQKKNPKQNKNKQTHLQKLDENPMHMGTHTNSVGACIVMHVHTNTQINTNTKGHVKRQQALLQRWHIIIVNREKMGQEALKRSTLFYKSL